MRVHAACQPATDVGFSERVRRVVSQDRWDLNSVEGVALMQAVLRETFPMATVLSHGVSAGSVRRTVALDVYRDGVPGVMDRTVRWTQAVYDLSGAGAYRAAAQVLGDGRAAEGAVERAFREVRPSAVSMPSVEAGGAAVEAASRRIAADLATSHDAAPADTPPDGTVGSPSSTGLSLRRGSVQRRLTGRALASLNSAQREALELAVLEELKVRAVAERMQTTASVVHAHLRDALLAVDSGEPLSAPETLRRWRAALGAWGAIPEGHRERPEQATAVAHAWLDYQTTSRAVPAGTIVLVTDSNRRFVATSGNAGETFRRPSLVGLQIDDVTASYAKPLLPDLWNIFDANGGMRGEYDCDLPDTAPARFPFHGVWGRPVSELQVGYLGAPLPVRGSPPGTG